MSSCRPFLGPGLRLAARWNRLVETVKTRKKREKTGKKWARYGLKRVNKERTGGINWVAIAARFSNSAEKPCGSSTPGCSTRKWPKFGHEGACVTFIRLGLVMLLPWGGQLAGRLRAPPGPAETGCNPLPHVRTTISERTIARAAVAIVSAFEAFRARSW